MVACNSGKSGIDSGLFDETTSCQPPCWQNLTPGKSTSEDVDQFLENLSATDWPERDTHSRYESSRKWIRIVSANYFNFKVVDIYMENGTLTFIRSHRSIKANLGQIVDRFGQPEAYEAILSEGPHESLYDVEVYYPMQGLAFVISSNPEDAGYINQNMLIKEVHYFLPGNLPSYFTQSFSYDYIDEAAIAEATQFQLEKFVLPWTGFGKVEIITLGP
jgi:hypothetical protein